MHPEAFQPAKPVDVARQAAIPILVGMMRRLSAIDDPNDVLPIVVDGLRRAYGPRCYVAITLVDGTRTYCVTRFLDYDGQDLLERGLLTPAEHGVLAGGFIGEIIADETPKLFQDLCLDDDAVFGSRFRDYGSLMAIPMYEDGIVTSWTLLFEHSPRGLTPEDLENAIVRINLIGATLHNVTTAKKLKAANDQIQVQIEHIARLQRNLLPESTPQISGLEIATSYEAYDRAGGDYYDFLPLARCEVGDIVDDSAPWGFLIADASGHGPAAAVIVAMLHAAAHAHPGPIDSAPEFLEYLNRTVFRRKARTSFITAFFGIYDPPTRTLRYASAGHPPPLLKRPTSPQGPRFLDDIGGTPLGVFDHVGSREGTIVLEPGQTLILYTDGISEAIAPTGEMFGLGRIERSIAECSGTPSCVIKSVTTALREHEAGKHPRDDQTMVCIRVV